MALLATAAAQDPSFGVLTLEYGLSMSEDVSIAIRAYVPVSPSGSAAGAVEGREPRSTDGAFAFAAVLYAHGGCFSEGDVTSHEDMARDLAARGLLVVSPGFRQGAAHPHPTALRDLGTVSLRARNYTDLPFGVAGSSSGGYFALALAADPARYTAPHPQREWRPFYFPFSFVVVFCPVFDPLARARYLRACVAGDAAPAAHHSPERAAEMLRQQEGYFSYRDAEMRGAAAAVAEPTYATPVFAVLGGADKNVPASVTAPLLAMADATLVRGRGGHELQSRLDAGDLDVVLSWLRRAVADPPAELVAETAKVARAWAYRTEEDARIRAARDAEDDAAPAKRARPDADSEL